MKVRSLFIFILILSSAVLVSSQTVTNVDLERYRQERLRAEREYRENYERLGLPSPEELDRQREESIRQTEELSAQLRAEELERERIEAYRQVELARSIQYNRQLQAEQEFGDYRAYPGFVSFGGYGGIAVGHRGFRGRHRKNFRHRPRSAYYAGGHSWPAGTVRLRPVRIPRRGSHRR